VQYIIQGKNAYSVSGGIKVVGCQVWLPAEAVGYDLAPSELFVLRDKLDRKKALITTLFGKVFDETGTQLPSDDEQTALGYVLADAYTIDAAECFGQTASAVFGIAKSTECLIKQAMLLESYRFSSDVSSDGRLALQTRRDQLWNQVKANAVTVSLQSGGSEPNEVSVTGVVVPGSWSCVYDDVLDAYSVQFKLVKVL
jgi:hypothetical protein